MSRITKIISSILSKLFGPLVNLGDTTTQESGGDSMVKSTKNVTNNYYGIESEEFARLQEKVGRDQEEGIESSRLDVAANVSIALGLYIGIVETVFSVQTRVHLEFAVFNGNDSPRALKGLLLEINDGVAHFKQFFKILENGSRVPDPSARLPHMINGKGGSTYSIEFENIEKKLLKSGINRGKIIVIMNDDTLASEEFTFTIDDAMEKTLDQVRTAAFKRMQPQVVDIMIKESLRP